MKAAIVHISDIHFRSKSDVAVRRQEKLANTIAFSRSADEQLIFAVTGDIANSGSAAEYTVALEFFRPLLVGLGIDLSAVPSPAIFIPGNHDCNFRGVGDLRPKLLEQIHDQLRQLDIHGETASSLLQVQSDFFDFVRQMSGASVPPGEQLFNTRVFAIGQFKLEIRSFNSAWLSRTNDKQGGLGLPSVVVEAAATKTDSDVVVSLIHHPHNWMDASTYQDFRAAIQETSDFLLTGHEHVLGGQVISSFSGSQLIHFEGGPFQPPQSGDSEFRILHLDLAQKTWRREDFKWFQGSYLKVSDGELMEIPSGRGRSASLQISAKMLRRLSDPGTGFLHHRKPQLALSDIYIFPDLKTRSLSKRLRVADDLPPDIPSQDVLTRILSTERMVLAGPTDCGKTALAKMMFLEANRDKGRLPLLIAGKDIAGGDPENAYKRAVDAAIDEAYEVGNHGRYAELGREQRLLLIDDWDEVGFNRAGRSEILRNATEHFGTVILFADDIFLIEELSGRHEYRPLENFQMADIKEFGFRLRGQIVRKWHTLGNAFIEDEQAFARNVADSTRVIDTVLGRNLLPSYPVDVITLLQTYDAGAGSRNSGLGSYGQVYEALITARLADVSVKSIDIGTKITFLSRIAWHLFSTGQHCISAIEWRGLVDSYFEEYKIRVDGEALLNSLLRAGMIARDQSDYRFSYGYTYCYFVAKYFQENLADLDDQSGRPELFDSLKRLSESVYKQDNANIVIFYLFLTKDRSLIHHVIANAKLIFGEFAEFDFDSHLQFVNRIIQPLTPVSLPGTSPEVNQQAYDERRDARGEQIEPEGEASASEVVYSAALPFEQKLVIGIRYLTLMGQILRNFPGSLKADTKLNLAFES